MRHIILKSGEAVKVDDDDFEYLDQWVWTLNAQGYAIRRAGSSRNGSVKVIRMHSVILPPEEGKVTDHMNRDKLDNRRSNLRLVTRHQNTLNRTKSHNTLSVYKGVTWVKGRRKPWVAQIKINRRHITLGYFSEEVEAAFVYDKAAMRLFGEYASLNFGGR